MTSYGWKLQVKCNDYSKNFDKDGSYNKISLFRLSACENTPQTVNTQSEFLRQIKHLISYKRKNDKALAQKSVYISTYRYLYIYTFTVRELPFGVAKLFKLLPVVLWKKKQARKKIEKTPAQAKWREWKRKVKLRLRKKTFELNSYAGDTEVIKMFLSVVFTTL